MTTTTLADTTLAPAPAATRTSRIAARFAALKAEGRGGLVTYLSCGDPDAATFATILDGLPAAGADVIEIGMPFTDPMADGPAIQAGGLRALNAGMTLKGTLAIIRTFREKHPDTPVVLMGYFNPIYSYGAEKFARDAADAGVDGLITVDLPPEEEEELRPFASAAGLDIVRLITPTTEGERLPLVLKAASGFIYYVSVLGITGTISAPIDQIAAAMRRVKAQTELPIAVGFGIKTPEQARDVAKVADAAVVGSALVQTVADNLDADGKPTPGLVPAVLGLVSALASGVRGAR